MNEENHRLRYIKATITIGVIIFVFGLIPISLGFGTKGIVRDSPAARIQSLIGRVPRDSFFALCTSLGMKGVFVYTVTIGVILIVGGFSAYCNLHLFVNDDAQLIHSIIEKGENPDIIINLLETKFPQQREEIKQKYNNSFPGRNFDDDISNYIPIGKRAHVANMLMNTNEIIIKTEDVRRYLNNEPFLDYLQTDFNDDQDAVLIQNIIENNDNPLIIIRLLNYRNKNQRKDIDARFREIKGDGDKLLFSYIEEFIPNHPDISYVRRLLE